MKLLLTLFLLLFVVSQAEAQFSLSEQQALKQMAAQWLSGGQTLGHIIEDEATPLTARSNLNMTGAGVTCADSGGKTTCTIAGGAGGGHVVRDEVSALTQRTNLSFLGAGVTCADNAGGDASECTIPSWVSSVAFAAPGQFSITGSPITTSGTITVSWQTQTANTILSGPTSGGAAVPTFRAMVVADTPSTTVHENQDNTYTAGTQSLAAATALIVPTATGAAPTASGSIAYDSTSDTWEIGIAGVNQTIATINDIQNIAHSSLDGLDVDDHSTIYPCFESGAGAPAAGTVNRVGCFYFDTTNTRVYGGYSVAGNYIDPGGQSDGVTGCSDGTNSCTVSGSETWLFARAASLGTEVKVFTSTGTFTNQPANDAIELISDSASDTGVDSCIIYGTTNGGDQSNIVIETLALTGTSPVSSVKLDWGKIYVLDCSGFTQVGTITIREASGNATITTIAPGGTAKAANQDTIIYKAAGASTPTQYIEMRLDAVDNATNNAFASRMDGTNFDYAGVHYLDAVSGRSFWSAYIPIASSSWTMVLHHKAASGTGTAVSLEVSCRSVGNDVLVDSTKLYIVGASGNPAEIALSGTAANLQVDTVAATDALTARARLFCEIMRVGGDANDSLSATWHLLGVSLEIVP